MWRLYSVVVPAVEFLAMFGDLVRQRRTEKFLTQAELAQRIGVSTTTLNRIEQGHTRPRLRTCRNLAAALELDPDELNRQLREQSSPGGPDAAVGQLAKLGRLKEAPGLPAHGATGVVLQRIAADVLGWLVAPDTDLLLHLSSLCKAALAVKGPAADPARALGTFICSVEKTIVDEAKVQAAAPGPPAPVDYRSVTMELVANLVTADEQAACQRFPRVSDAYARLLLTASARSFHEGATFFARQRAALMLHDMQWAAEHPDAETGPPRSETRRTVDAFPSVLLAFDAANDPERTEPLLSAKVAAQALVPA